MEKEYNVQLTVILYKKKYYISPIAAIAIGEKLDQGTTIMFGNKILIGVRDKDKHLITKYPVYDIDSALASFVKADMKLAAIYIAEKKNCFQFDGIEFISLQKLQLKNKYYIRFSMPTVKIFGAYYILCGKQKDVNTKIVVVAE